MPVLLARHAEVSADLGTLSESLRVGFVADLSLLEHVAAVGVGQREHSVLLRHEDRQRLVPEQLEPVSQILHHRRRKPFSGLVEQQQARVGQKSLRDLEHLLLAAAQEPCSPFGKLGEAGEDLEDPFYGPCSSTP